MAGHRCGVLYVATEHARFLTEARRSATSLRSWMPRVHITLFTDRPELATECGDVFDSVEELQPIDGPGVSWGWGLLNKVRACARSSYDRSIYLDTDTRILTPRIRELFDVLDDHDIALAPCEPGESRSCKIYGRPMFNAGVIAFRRSPAIAALLDAWRELHEAHLRALAGQRLHRLDYARRLSGADRYRLLVNDQTALARYLAPDGVNAFGVRCCALPKIWNWRRREIDPAHADDVVIHHSTRFKVDDLLGAIAAGL